MFVRVTTVKRGDKVYEYPQLVESYRDENGTPTHRVLKSLKDFPPEAVEALDLTLKAIRTGKTVSAVAPNAKQGSLLAKVLQNLVFLPIAVYRTIWDDWGLSELLDGLLSSPARCTDAQLVQMLVLHRAIAPGSKLSACRWYPRTALPELLGVNPRYVNNSRVHRVLDALCDADEKLQAALAPRISNAGDGVLATFIDLTDTWFVGRGPEMARKGKTKEGLYRKKIGIVLLCDQRGYPLMWKTVQGGRYEPPVMLELIKKGVETGLLTCQPLVMDRAMGRSVHLAELDDVGAAFVTMLTRTEYTSFIEQGPWDQFEDVQLTCSPQTHQREVERLGKLAVQAGMTPAGGGRFVLDVGIGPHERAEPASADTSDPLAALLRELDFMEEALASGMASSVTELASWYGVDRATVSRYRQLRTLCPEVRDRILNGDAALLDREELNPIAHLPASEQVASFDALLDRTATRDRRTGKPPKILDQRRRHLLLRRVVCFSPELLLRRHETARSKLVELQADIEVLNEAQRVRSTPRTPLAMMADAHSLLKRQHWLNLFGVTTTVRRMNGREHHELVLTRDDRAWGRRRRLDGFGVLVASPKVRRSAEALVDLYFSKDVVENDFRTIKSEIDLRPVRHRTDPKVKAHVTLCVLALLLQRTLEERIRAGGEPMTAARAEEELGTCYLNRLASEGAQPYYAVTQPTDEQRQLLAHLGLSNLLDNAHIKAAITPR